MGLGVSVSVTRVGVGHTGLPWPMSLPGLVGDLACPSCLRVPGHLPAGNLLDSWGSALCGPSLRAAESCQAGEEVLGVPMQPGVSGAGVGRPSGAYQAPPSLLCSWLEPRD